MAERPPVSQGVAAPSHDELLDELRNLARLIARGVPGCDGASISVLQEDEPSTLAASEDRIQTLDEAQYTRDVGPCVTAMRDHTEISVTDYDTEGRWPEVDEHLRAAGVRSSLSLPLSRREKVIGGLNLYAQQPEAFTPTSRAAADAFGRQAVVMMGYLEQLHSERAARTRERDVSAALQESLLPNLPDLPGISCAARYLVGSTHAQVGGDWYDLFALPDGAIGVAIGDVMGHDLAAAAAMGQLRSVLRSYAYEGSSPSVVLDRLDRLVQDFGMAQLATAIYGRLVLQDRSPGSSLNTSAMLLFTNAGHLPPLLRAPDGTVTILRRGSAPLIGAMAPGEARRGEGAVLLPAGSLLLLYTDGLVETRTDDIDTRIDALADALAAQDERATPDEVCDALIAPLGQGGQHDDVAILALRIDTTADARPGQPGA